MPLYTLTVTGRTTWVLLYGYSNIQEYSILGLSPVAQEKSDYSFPSYMQQKLWHFHICNETALLSFTVIPQGGAFLLLTLTPGPCQFLLPCTKDSIQLLEQLLGHSYILTCKGKFGNITLPINLFFH